MTKQDLNPEPLVSSGVPGLDEVLQGGFVPLGAYLVEGVPGAGKTTLGLQFLLEGVRLGEASLHITLSESKADLQAAAQSHGWSLDGIAMFELLDAEREAGLDEQYTMFHSSEVELGESSRQIVEAVERTGAKRVVIDSIAELRLMAQNPLWFRRQLLSMKRFFARKGCTVLLMEEHSEQIRTIAEGVILLEHTAGEYGRDRRRLRVLKLRKKQYTGGYHDFNLITGGMQVFPRLIAQQHRRDIIQEDISSGLPEMDKLTGGGIPQGSSTLVMGPSGVGKSSVTNQFIHSFLEKGGKAAAFLFDEKTRNLLARTKGLGIDLEPYLQSGALSVQEIDPAELSPGEFAATVQNEVDRGAGMVLIDSLGGYFYAMPDERYLMLHMHELLSTVGHRGVTTLMVGTQHGMVGSDVQSVVDLSYLSDTVILLRYFEARGEVKKAISVMKKRTGEHDRKIRELILESGGIRIGEPFREFQGVLTGHPSFQSGSAGVDEGR